MKACVASTIPFLGALALAACSDAPTTPEATATVSSADGSESRVQAPLRVLTRNLYIGGSTSRVLGAGSPAEIPALVAQTWASIQANDFNQRARLIAREVAATRPHAIGLQEVALLRTQSPGDALIGNPQSATEVAYDFLEILMSELDRLGQAYRVASVVQNVDIELPLATSPTTFDDVRYTDRGVILVRRGIRVVSSSSGNFAADVSFPVGGAIPVTIPRGWNRVQMMHRGQTYHFLNAHLETAETSVSVQEAQAAELIGLVQGVTDPAIIVGDLNGSPLGDTGTYDLVIGAGFTDAWEASRGPGGGLTCCYSEDLRSGALFKRIDYVMARGPGAAEPQVVGVTVVGDSPRYSRTPSGLRPSDHLGVFASLRFRSEVAEHR